MEALLIQQKVEVEECEAKVAQLKAQLASASKKKKKSIKFDLTLAEGQLQYLAQTHEDQRGELEGGGGDGDGDGDGGSGGGGGGGGGGSGSEESAAEPAPVVEQQSGGSVTDGGDSSGGKKSKAQKRREKKEREEKERNERIAKVEPAKGASMKEVEYAQIMEVLSTVGGLITPIKPDGHCMFRAISTQCDGAIDVDELRTQTAAYLREHKDDFAPFLTNEKGDCMNAVRIIVIKKDKSSEYDAYCTSMGTKAVWGGECELKAISSILKRPIRVFQSAGGVRVIGDELEGDAILLSYHRHEFSMGEHYNAVKVVST